MLCIIFGTPVYYKPISTTFIILAYQYTLTSWTGFPVSGDFDDSMSTVY